MWHCHIKFLTRDTKATGVDNESVAVLQYDTKITLVHFVPALCSENRFQESWEIWLIQISLFVNYFDNVYSGPSFIAYYFYNFM